MYLLTAAAALSVQLVLLPGTVSGRTQTCACEGSIHWTNAAGDYIYQKCNGDWTSSSSHKDCCCRRRGRNLDRIEEYGVKGLKDEDLQAIDNNCGSYEYDLKLHVDSHLYLILDPKEEALSAGCQTLVFHASDMEI